MNNFQNEAVNRSGVLDDRKGVRAAGLQYTYGCSVVKGLNVPFANLLEVQSSFTIVESKYIRPEFKALNSVGNLRVGDVKEEESKQPEGNENCNFDQPHL